MSSADVVIVAYNSREQLADCVWPLLGIDWIRLIVVDNASPDDSGAAVAGLPVTVVRERENRGFGAGCNAGFRVGAAPYVLFLNPDAAIDPQSLGELVHTLEQDPTLGAAGPRIVNDDGSLDHSIRRFPRLRSTYAQALFAHLLAPNAGWADEVVRDASRYESPGAAEWLSGACLLVRRSALEAIGGFDEGFFMYCEDTDLCRRIWNLGLAVRYQPSAVAVHKGGASVPRSSLLPVLAASRSRYADTHRGRLAAAGERIGIALGSLTHLVAGRGGGAARRGHLAAVASTFRTART
jgi:GT2 family glycosyltransferase